MPERTAEVDARPLLRDIVIDTLSRAGADMAQVGIDQIVTEAVDRIESVTPPECQCGHDHGVSEETCDRCYWCVTPPGQGNVDE